MRRYLLIAFLLLSTMGNVVGKSAFRPGKDYALFFANDDYSNNPQFKDLKNPVRDAEAIEQELKEMFGFKLTYIPTTPKRRSTKSYKNGNKSFL